MKDKKVDDPRIRYCRTCGKHLCWKKTVHGYNTHTGEAETFYSYRCLNGPLFFTFGAHWNGYGFGREWSNND